VLKHFNHPFLPKRRKVWRRRLRLKVLADGFVDPSRVLVCGDRPISDRLLRGHHLEGPFAVAAVTGMTEHGASACRTDETNIQKNERTLTNVNPPAFGGRKSLFRGRYGGARVREGG